MGEMVVVSWKILSRNLTGNTEENYKLFVVYLTFISHASQPMQGPDGHVSQ
jgi:hypothetical protein